jgi:hypothetical protein
LKIFRGVENIAMSDHVDLNYFLCKA